MMFICASETVKMWQLVVPEPEAVRSISSCTPSWVLTSRCPLPCMVVSATERRSIQRPNLLLARYLARVMLGLPPATVPAPGRLCVCPCGLKWRVNSCHMSLPLMPSLYTRLGTPFTVTFTLVMSGLKKFSVFLAPATKGLMNSSRMPLSDRRCGFTRKFSLVSDPRVIGTTRSRMTRSYANSLPLIYVLFASSARVLLRITSYSSWIFSNLYPSLLASDPRTTWFAEARVSSNTKSLYSACG